MYMYVCMYMYVYMYADLVVIGCGRNNKFTHFNVMKH